MTLKNIGNAQDLPNKPKGKKILIVDDIPLFARTMKMNLANHNGVQEENIVYKKTLEDTEKYLFEEGGIHEVGAVLMDRDMGKGKYTNDLVALLQAKYENIKIYSTSTILNQSEEYKLTYISKEFTTIPDLMDALGGVQSETSSDYIKKQEEIAE